MEGDAIKMPCPSRDQCSSGAEPTGLMNTHSIAPNSSSVHSDIISGAILLERELAREALQKELATSEHPDGLRVPTISYEEAVERELEYRKRLKMMQSQTSVGSSSLSTSSRVRPGLPPKPSPLGVKKKAVSELYERIPKGENHIGPAPAQVKDMPPVPLFARLQRPSLQNLQAQQHAMQRPQYHTSPTLGFANRQPTVPGPKYRYPSPQRMHYQPPGQQLGRQLQTGQDPRPNLPSYRCWLCQVECVTAFNYEQHLQGKRHKGNVEKIFGSNEGAASDGAGTNAIAEQDARSKSERDK